MDNKPFDSLPPVELPKPTAENSPATQEFIPDAPITEIASARALEQGNPLASQPIDPGVVSSGIPMSGVPAPDLTHLAVPVNGTPAIADDTDLIEKEWVEKAKEIVARTKADPYQQNKELTRMKADYLKKRYNKDLKVSDE